MASARRCPRCPHVAHRDECGGKAPYGCVPLDGGGHLCYRGVRAPCPCPLGACHTCRAVIAGATPDGHPGIEIDFDEEPGDAPGGTWAVRGLADGSLGCRPLVPGEDPGPGEWRGRAHAHQLEEATSACG